MPMQETDNTRFNLSRWALEHPALTRYLMVVLMVLGMASYFQLGQDEDPPFTFRAMVVRTYWPGATAQQVAEQVTDKIELALQSVPEIDFTKSSTRAGSTTIIVQLRSDTAAATVPDVWYRVRKVVLDAQAQGKLPAGISGPYFNDDFGDTFGNIYALTGDGFTYPQLKAYADTLRDRIRALPEVAKVEYQGDQPERIFIEYDSTKLASLGISPQTVAQTLATTNSIIPAGQIDTNSERIRLTVSGAFDSLESIRNIGIVASNVGQQHHFGKAATLGLGGVTHRTQIAIVQML